MFKAWEQPNNHYLLSDYFQLIALFLDPEARSHVLLTNPRRLHDAIPHTVLLKNHESWNMCVIWRCVKRHCLPVHYVCWNGAAILLTSRAQTSQLSWPHNVWRCVTQLQLLKLPFHIHKRTRIWSIPECVQTVMSVTQNLVDLLQPWGLTFQRLRARNEFTKASSVATLSPSQHIVTLHLQTQAYFFILQHKCKCLLNSHRSQITVSSLYCSFLGLEWENKSTRYGGHCLAYCTGHG
jgi:hypothetical protein